MAINYKNIEWKEFKNNYLTTSEDGDIMAIKKSKKPILLVIGAHEYAYPILQVIPDLSCGYVSEYLAPESSLNLEDVVLALFTGGEDVNPNLYGQRKISATHFNHGRDIAESKYFDLLKERNVPMIGICRGAQFLWVKLGGQLFQDIENHTNDHQIFDFHTGKMYQVNSLHHQSIYAESIKDSNIRILTVAVPPLSSHHVLNDQEDIIFTAEVEGFYHSSGILGVQWHPEVNDKNHLFKFYVAEFIKDHLPNSLYVEEYPPYPNIKDDSAPEIAVHEDNIVFNVMGSFVVQENNPPPELVRADD